MAKAKPSDRWKMKFKDISIMPCKKYTVAQFWSGPKPKGIANRSVVLMGPARKVEEVLRVLRKYGSA